MTFRSLTKVSLLACAAAPALLLAQTETTGREDERMEALARSESEWAAPKNKVSIGFRVLSSGGKVDFKNLGTVPFSLTIPPASDGEVQRTYSNGIVGVDALRATEKDANGHQTSTPGGRYPVYTTVAVPDVDANGNTTGTTHDVTSQTGDYLSYTAGLTRNWQGYSETQLARSGYVSFSAYSTTSDGGTTSHKQGPSGGVEFQISRDIGRGTRVFKWGMQAGIALNDINSKSAGTVNSTLHTYTDYYSLNGQTITAVHLTNPSFGEYLDSNGNTVNASGYETTVPLATIPDASQSTNTAVAGGAAVAGKWQVKGAYLMVKFGPSMHAQITERLGLSASLGLAGAYAGTRYTAYESYSVADLPDVVMDTTESSTATKFLTGYYADLNLEWATNETMGLFGGVTAQQLSDYEQQLGTRTAKVDLGSSVGIRGGVSIKF